MSHRLGTKRVHAPPAEADGLRVLVDRLWPRGMSKAQARIDLRLKEVAPSAELRRWFGHDRDRFEAFKARYFEELDQRPAAVETLLERLQEGPVTLLYAASDPEHNNAVALKAYLEGRLAR